MRETLLRAVQNQETAGVNLLILRNGEELFYLEEGYADLEQKKKMERDTICRLYSMTKPVTAAAVFWLAERGLLDLAQPVESLIPSFADQKVCQADGIMRCDSDSGKKLIKSMVLRTADRQGMC